ncbi:MAG: DUF4827 family protein [Porphyromonas sp.]|nr:DUF4827 family protein [Porphyromonas sp.]
MVNKKTYFTLSLATILFATLFISCDKNRLSYVDIIKREKKQIEQLISERNFKITSAPAEGQVSPEKEFFEVQEGIYLRIVDRGDLKKKAVSGKTVVITRFKMERFAHEEKTVYDNISPDKSGSYPANFIYIKEGREILSSSTIANSSYNTYLSPAMNFVLPYLGDGGKVQMIVSFKYGPSLREVQENGEPVFYELVEFKFKK